MPRRIRPTAEAPCLQANTNALRPVKLEALIVNCAVDKSTAAVGT